MSRNERIRHIEERGPADGLLTRPIQAETKQAHAFVGFSSTENVSYPHWMTGCQANNIEWTKEGGHVLIIRQISAFR